MNIGMKSPGRKNANKTKPISKGIRTKLIISIKGRYLGLKTLRTEHTFPILKVFSANVFIESTLL